MEYFVFTCGYFEITMVVLYLFIKQVVFVTGVTLIVRIQTIKHYKNVLVLKTTPNIGDLLAAQNTHVLFIYFMNIC